MTAADPHCAMLSDLSRCAYRLGMAFGNAAERADDHPRRLEYFQLFDRCFFAVRVATALELRLRREARQASPAEPPDWRERCDPPERERPERDGPEAYDERDREREVEPASLPVLLRTLEDVADDASNLPGPEPAALPTLRELLAHMKSDPAAAAAAAPPKAAASLKARLTGSGAATALQFAPPPRRAGPDLAIRPATGPPRR